MLTAGRLVALPTETVYGLAADATDPYAVALIYEAKGRPSFNPLIVHIAKPSDAESLCILNDAARKLVSSFWPGPLTLVATRLPNCPIAGLVSAGLPTLAIRCPAHATARAIIEAAGRPLAAPSANRSGHVSPTTADHVLSDLNGRIDAVVDAGPTSHGLESTVVDISQPDRDPIVLRPGAITAEELSAVLGQEIGRSFASPDAPTSPGQLESHYAPSARLRLNVSVPDPGEALLAFGESVPAHCAPMRNLSQTGDLVEAAANLFDALRALDAEGCASIAVMPIPGEGLGEAINDRLLRAAAPRPAGP